MVETARADAGNLAGVTGLGHGVEVGHVWDEGALDRLRRVARLLVGDSATADELAAEAVARTLEAERRRTVHEPDAYARRVLVNLVNRRWRRRALAGRRDHAALDWLPAGRDDGADVVERDRTLRAVLALPPRRRAVVVLRFYEDRSEADIAAVLGISLGTVKSQLSRALGQLRAELGDQERR